MKNLEKNKINNEKEKKIERNYGIDLLRIFSMIQVLILHLILYTNEHKAQPSNKKYKKIWFLESFSMSCVNSFGLISGVVGYKSYKFRNLIYLWFQILFYSFLVLIISYKIDNKTIFSKSIIIDSIFPILYNRNWYFNCYFIMYLFIPFLNEGIKIINRKTFRNLIIFYIFFFLIYDIFRVYKKISEQYHQLNNGYSALWLIILYIIGSYFGKYIINNEKNENLKYFIKWILIYIFLNFLNYELNFWFIYKKNLHLKQTFFKKYINPIVLFQAISLLMIFSKLKIKNKLLKKIISFFSPLVFGVLLFHSRIRRLNFMRFYFNKIKNIKQYYFFYSIIFLAIFFFIFCALVDYIRLLIFNFLKIKELSIFIENKVPEFIDKIIINLGLEKQIDEKIKD